MKQLRGVKYDSREAFWKDYKDGKFHRQAGLPFGGRCPPGVGRQFRRAA